MDPDEYETLTEVRDYATPLQVVVDFNMLVREHGEDTAYQMLHTLRELFAS